MTVSTSIDVAVRAGRLDRLLDLAETAASVAQRRYLVDAIERALLLADPGAVSPRDVERARRLGTDASLLDLARSPLPPHAVIVPLVLEPSGDGFARAMYVAHDVIGVTSIESALDATAQRSLQAAIELAARVAKRPPPARDRVLLTAAQPDALLGTELRGASLGGAALVSAVALWTHRPVRAGTAVTAAIRDGAIAPVGKIAAKLDALRGRPEIRRVLVARADLAEAHAAADSATPSFDVVGVSSIDALVDTALEAEPTPSTTLHPDEAMETARRAFGGAWEGFRWATTREQLERLAGELPARRPELRVEALARLAAARRHLGAPEQSLLVLSEAARIARSKEGRAGVPDAPLAYLWQQIAMTHRQLCRFDDARTAAQRAVAIARRARLRGELLQALGCAGLVEMARGRPVPAARRFRSSLEIAHVHRPQGCARSHTYLVDALSRARDVRGAQREYERAIDHLAALPASERSVSHVVWLKTALGGALVTAGRAGEARRILDDARVRDSIANEPEPGLLARRAFGLALVAAGDAAYGFELLAASTVAHGLSLEPRLRFLAHLNVLYEARARLAARAWNADVAGRARAALAHLPRYGRVPALLGRLPEKLAAALPGTDSAAERTGRALDALLARCTPLT